MSERTVTGEAITQRPDIDADKSPRDWLLSFIAGCSLVLQEHVDRLFRIHDDVPGDLIAELLADALIVAAPRLRGQGAAYQITADGLRALGSDLPRPRVDLRRYWEDVNAVWLAVDVRVGVFGPEVERVYTRREMAAADRRLAGAGLAVSKGWSPAVRAKAADASFAVSVSGEEGSASSHYPDLTLVIPQGRVAMELFLVTPSRRRAAAVVDAYARKPQLVTAILIAPGPAEAKSLWEIVCRCGAEERIRVQHAQFTLA